MRRSRRRRSRIEKEQEEKWGGAGEWSGEDWEGTGVVGDEWGGKKQDGRGVGGGLSRRRRVGR